MVNRTDVAIKLLLVVFLSILSFCIGTFVGKQFSDAQDRLNETRTYQN